MYKSLNYNLCILFYDHDDSDLWQNKPTGLVNKSKPDKN